MRLLPLVIVTLGVAAACTDTKQPPVVPHSPLADSADQVMFGVRHILTKDGLQQAELLSDTAFIFEDGTRIELRTVHLTFYTKMGAKNAVLTSREGLYNTRSQTMEARRDVDVTTTDGRRLVTEQLKFDQARNEISSDSAFTLTEPGRRLNGIGFTSDPDMKFMRCLSACSGTAGEVALPVGGDAVTAPAAPRPARDSAPRQLPPGSAPGRTRLPD